MKLYLYSTLGCHLCSDAKTIVVPVLQEVDIDLVEVDIADDPSLVDAYGERIPVIKSPDTGNELGWPFDTLLFIQWLQDNLL